MAVTDAYATATEYRSSVDKVDTSEDAEILEDLTAVSRLLDAELGRHFTKDAVAVARDFQALCDGRFLYVDDMASTPSQVLVDENDDGTPEITYTVGLTGDVQPFPINAALGSEPRPYTALYVTPWSTKSLWVPGRLVRVTAQWGWPAVPRAIKSACIHLTALLRAEGQRAQTQITDVGLVQLSPAARNIVDRLSRSYAKRGGVSV